MRYAAFISYSSSDRALGEQLQKSLESYVVPAPLRGRDFGYGPVPKRISPIFRDRWDAEASADLGVTLKEALQASAALIVLCSPAAARSTWVGREIRVFKRAGRGDRIYPVLIDGLPDRFDPDHNPQGAFPPALFERWDESGTACVLDERKPLAPDLRPEGDGLHFTVLKLTAALTGVPLTTLTQRQAEAERRERNTARWIAGAMTLLALGAVIGAWTSWRASVEARTRLLNAVEMAARRVDDAASFQDRYGVPSSVIHDLLNGAKKDFDELTRGGAATPTLMLQRARLDRSFAELYEAVGDGGQHKAMAMRAMDLLAQVPTEHRIDAPGTWFAVLPPVHSVAVERILALGVVGQVKAAEGDLSGARSVLQSMASEADALARRSGDDSALSLAANARAYLSRLSYESGELERALQELGEAASILSSDALKPKNAVDLAKIQSDEAEMLLELGRHAEALARQQTAVETLEKVSAPTPGTRRALAAALARRGDMHLAAQRDLERARADYLSARSMLTDLLAADEARADIKRDLSLTQERVGDSFLQAGDVDRASEAFEACLTLRRELVARDRSNVEWRRDLSVALERMGDVYSLQGRHEKADAAYSEVLSLRETALSDNTADVVATRDLAVLWIRIGKARINAHKQLSEIDSAYEKAIRLLSPLVEKASGDSRWKRDLAVAYAERGEARRHAGEIASARRDMKTALGLIEELRAAAPDDIQLEQDENWLRQQLETL